MELWQQDFLREQRLPAEYLETAERYFHPLAEQLADRARDRTMAITVAVNGSQGSGKTTLCAYLVAALAARHGARAIALSLDDFYLTRAEREALADAVHPLFATRGVPGTHDMQLLAATVDALRAGSSGDPPVAVPRFDKSIDDRVPGDEWRLCRPPLDLVLLEGWCLGAASVPEEELRDPCNALEREEDAQGRWRAYSNRQLAEHYEPAYALFDYWVMLAAPSFEQVLAWREEQEDKLRRSVGGRGRGLMSHAELARFVAHFERHTRNCLARLPQHVDVLYRLDEQRRIAGCDGLATPP